MELPMLTDEEWPLVAPHLSNMAARVMRYVKEHGCSLAEAQRAVGSEALAMYEKLTGFEESNVNALYHHRLSMYGPPCHVCGKPLRAPLARYCAMCSAERTVPAKAQQ
jgi:hypothetical protein